jgi:hypothetical protein
MKRLTSQVAAAVAFSVLLAGCDNLPTSQSGNRECRDVEDLLSDAGKVTVIKMCRTLPNGNWVHHTRDQPLSETQDAQ